MQIHLFVIPLKPKNAHLFFPLRPISRGVSTNSPRTSWSQLTFLGFLSGLNYSPKTEHTPGQVTVQGFFLNNTTFSYVVSFDSISNLKDNSEELLPRDLSYTVINYLPSTFPGGLQGYWQSRLMATVAISSPPHPSVLMCPVAYPQPSNTLIGIKAGSYWKGLEGGTVMHYAEFVSINVNKKVTKTHHIYNGEGTFAFSNSSSYINLGHCNDFKLKIVFLLYIFFKKGYLFLVIVDQPVYYRLRIISVLPAALDLHGQRRFHPS